MRLGDRIAAWRIHKGWTQRELADQLGLTPAAIYQWEGSGKGTTPHAKHLEAMAKALGITMERFYGPLPKTKKGAA